MQILEVQILKYLCDPLQKVVNPNEGLIKEEANDSVVYLPSEEEEVQDSVEAVESSSDESESEDEKKPKTHNYLREIKTVKQLEKINLDFDSPRLKEAMLETGIT